MARKLTPDKWLFAATVGLALFGVVMVYSASAIMAERQNGSQFYYVIKQGMWTMIGFGVMWVAMQFNYQQLKRRRIIYGLMMVTVILLVAVFCISQNERRASMDQAFRFFDTTFRTIEARLGDLSRLLPGEASRRRG